MNNCNRSRLYNAKFKTKDLRPIGKGRQGIVFVVSEHANGSHPFAMKVIPYDIGARSRGEPQPSVFEYKNQEAVSRVAPEGVVQVMKYKRCENFVNPTIINMPNVQNTAKFNKSKQSVMYMEYCAGGDLKSWLGKQRKLNDSVMHHLISTILKSLYKIQTRYPDFRHNDLHIQNIFVSDRGFLIGDFGWSRLKKNGTNPAVNTANGTSTASFWGVGPKTDARYDQHMFLNELLAWIKTHTPSRFPKTFAFLNTAVPDGYRGESDTHVIQWRLKYSDPCPGLPSLYQLIHNKYMTDQRITSLNLVTARRKLRKIRVSPRKKTSPVRVRSLSLKKRKASPKRRRSAPARAGTGKNYSKLLNLSPLALRRLTTRNRNRILALRKRSVKRASPPKRLKVNRRGSPGRVKINFELSPVSGRMKIQGPTGRLVYADGSTITLDYLRNLARRSKVNISGLANKREIVAKIFKR